MHHRFTETRYYVLDNSDGDEFYGCPIRHFASSEEAIAYADLLIRQGRAIKVEEVTWQNDSHRSHSIIYSAALA